MCNGQRNRLIADGPAPPPGGGPSEEALQLVAHPATINTKRRGLVLGGGRRDGMEFCEFSKELFLT